MKRIPVVILGGGISGLACAHALFRRNTDFLLLEKQPRLGGTIHTVREDEFVLDTGPDAFLTQKPAALALAKELGLESRLLPTNPRQRTVYVLLRGRLHPLPEGMVLTVPTRFLPLARSGLFSWRGKLRMALEPFVPPRTDASDESIASFVERRLGREALERLAEPLLAGIHSGEPERLSMHALFPRFVTLEQTYGSLVKGMRRATRARPAPSAAPSLFMSLREGLGELVSSLAHTLPEDRVRCGVEARAIRRTKEGFEVDLSSGERVAARSVVVAVPLAAAARLTSSLSARLSSALDEIPLVSTAIVFLAYPRRQVEHPLAGYGFVVPRTERSRFLAGTFVSTKFPGRAPDSHVLLRAFFGGARDPAALELDDDELVGVARSDLEGVLGTLGAPSLARVFRWENKTPQMEVGHAQKLAAIEDASAQLPGLHVIGNGLRGVGIPDCIADGQRAAGALVEAARRDEALHRETKGRG